MLIEAKTPDLCAFLTTIVHEIPNSLTTDSKDVDDTS